MQMLQKTLFHEKQKIIENCLFGVDINPNSVKICMLRLWIELLKNAYYKDETSYAELETLPNIDINIKCGNSLLSRFGLKDNLHEAFKKQKFNLEAYKSLVGAYRKSRNRSEKIELLEVIKNIEWDLQDLEETIQKAEEKKAKIKLDDSELNSRRRFIRESRENLDAVKKHMQNRDTRGKIEKDQRETLFARETRAAPTNSRQSRIEKVIEDDNEDFMRNEKQRQLQLRKEEDENLEEISVGVDKLHEMGLTIGDELASQESLIQRLGDEVEETKNKLSSAVKRVSELIDKSSNSTSYGVIIFLIAVLILLLVVVFYI